MRIRTACVSPGSSCSAPTWEQSTSTAGKGARPAGNRRVVVATGGLPRPAEFAAGHGAVIVAAADVLARAPSVGESLPGGPVVVHDPVGGPVGVGLAEFLAAAGRGVTVVTPDRVVGSRLGGDLAPANGRLMRAGVRRETSTLLTAVDAAGAVLADRWTGAERRIRCAALVDCGPLLPRAPLEGAALVGDALSPRTVLEAVLDGRRAATSILGQPADGR